MSESSNAAPVLDDFGRCAVVFLNEYLKPWVFVGSEPVTVALAQLLREKSAEVDAAFRQQQPNSENQT